MDADTFGVSETKTCIGLGIQDRDVQISSRDKTEIFAHNQQ